MSNAATKQNRPGSYQKHGDFYRQRLLKERGTDAIDGRSRSGREAKAWRRYALSKKGGKACPVDVKAKIDAGTFYLWRALELRAYIVADARTRGTPLNRRYGKLPAVNDQYDVAINQFLKINDELALDKGTGLDLAQRFAQAQREAGK